MKEFKTSKGEFLAVKVPENSIVKPIISMGYIIFKCHNLENGVTDAQLSDYNKLSDYLSKHDPKKDYKEIPIKLPFDKYSIIGLRTEITEEQAKEVVEYIPEVLGYYHYTATNDDVVVDTALESYHSLMQANEIYSENPLANYQPYVSIFDNDLNSKSNIERSEWQQAQENTGNWLMLKKL